MFDVAMKKFDEYCKVRGATPGFSPHLAAEVQIRLQQLQYIVERVRQLERSHGQDIRRVQSAFAAGPGTQTLTSGGTSGSLPSGAQVEIDAFWSGVAEHEREIRLLTESFYYFAHRIWKIACHRSTPLPGLRFECPGVRDVRNMLIEHPEKAASPVYAQSFGFGYPESGPRLKTTSPPQAPDVVLDRGLYANAREFESSFVRRMELSISSQP
jgi:hypothetical protein